MSYMAGGFTFLLFGMKSRLGSGTAMSVNYAAIICKEGKLLYHDNFTEIDIFMTIYSTTIIYQKASGCTYGYY